MCAGRWHALANEAATDESLVVFALDEQEFALGIAVVERVVRAVEITPLPSAAPGVRGVINLEGSMIPVFDLRARFGLPARALRASDHLVIARAARRLVAVLVDSVVGVAPRAGASGASSPEISPGPDAIEGAVAVGGGTVFIHDLDRFLSLENMHAPDAALEG